MNNTNNNSRIARNTLFLYVRMFFVLIITLYTSRVVLRTLGVVDFGVNNVVAGFVSMFAFINTSLTGAIQRYYNYERSTNGDEGVTKVFQTSMLVQIGLAVVLLIVLEAFGVWYVNNVMVIPEDRLIAANVLFQISLCSFVLLILSVPFSSAIISFEHMDYYAFVEIAGVILKLAVVLVLPLVNFDKLIAYSSLLFSVSLLTFILYLVYAKKKFKALKFKLSYNKELFKSMLVFSGWNFFGTFSSIVYQQGVNLLLNFFFGPVVNAARGLSTYVYSAIRSFSSNIVMAFRPQLVESYASRNFVRTKHMMFGEAKICYLMLLALTVPVIIEINYILRLWLGNDIPDHTVSFTILVLIHMLVVSLNGPFSQIVHASGVMKKFQLITGSITCLIIPLGWIALRMGSSAEFIFVISIGLAVCSQIACILIVKDIFDYGVKDYLVKVIIPVVLSSTIVPVFPWLLHTFLPISFLRVVLVFVCSIITTCGYGYYVMLNTAEKQVVIILVKRFLNKK